MKKAGSERKREVYVCRKCDRRKFKNAMEFTNHLRNCRVVDVPVTQMPVPVGNGVKAELQRLHSLSGEIRDLTARLLKVAK
jgi:hypothetical protein